MGATSDDLMDIARAGAERIDMPDSGVRYPSFSDIEEQCAAEYDELLEALHGDELFAPAMCAAGGNRPAAERAPQRRRPRADRGTGRQSGAAVAESEAAFHLGMAVGLRLAEGRRH
jgi:hypothetical protein